jgi:hypothetical protein
MDDKTTALTRAEKGGLARAKKLSKEQLSQSAKKAAEARWGADLPQACNDGPLQIGDALLIAAVLPNGKRLLAQGTFLKAIGRSRTPKAGTGGLSTGVDGLPFFLQADALKPFITEELKVSTTKILFRLKSGQRAVGYDAMLLPMVCEVYLNYRDACLRDQGKVPKQYQHIIEACYRLTRGLARRGIIALVDDATGYRANQAKEDMLRVIARYLAPNLLTWTRKFPPEFFEEIYRIYGWEYKPGSIKHPQYVGKLINKYIYEVLPPGVLEAMKQRLPKNESGNRSARLWQTLSIDTGIPHLDRQITEVYVIMRLSEDKKDLEDKFQAIFGKQRRLRFQVMKEFKGLLA